MVYYTWWTLDACSSTIARASTVVAWKCLDNLEVGWELKTCGNLQQNCLMKCFNWNYPWYKKRRIKSNLNFRFKSKWENKIRNIQYWRHTNFSPLWIRFLMNRRFSICSRDSLTGNFQKWGLGKDKYMLTLESQCLPGSGGRCF